MNRTLKEATVRRYHYATHQQLREHLAAFLDAYNFAKRLKTLRGITPYERVCKAWADDPDRFRYDPTHLTSGLNNVEWWRIEPLMPRGRKGAHRVDDRRVISGIVRMLKSGARWRDCPEVYGPYTTVYNRFNRWSRQGIWTDIFYALTGSTGMYGSMSVDSSYVKAHRSAAGAKGGPSTMRSAARAAGKRPKSTR